jgi:hypothetical protein
MLDRAKELLGKAKAEQARTRAHFPIPPERVEDRGAEDLAAEEPFAPHRHYFQVVVNEMHLANSREWHKRYEPMVFVAATYIYDKDEQTSPFVVGSALLKRFGQPLPSGLIYRNVPVTGLHPYQGGALTLTVFLIALESQNNADRLLDVVERIAGAVSPSIAFTTYLKLADPVMRGVESLLGLDEARPILGHHGTTNPDVRQRFVPEYFAMIDADEAQVDPTRFHVCDSRLHMDDGNGSVPYRERDFVLFKVTQGVQRSDEQTLPFFPLWREALDFAGTPDDASWREAKARFLTLNRTLRSSPDLTEPDADRLRSMYLEQLKRARNQAVDYSNLGNIDEPGPVEVAFRDAADELDRLD